MASSEPEQAAFFIQWWQQILSGTIVIVTGLLLRAKGVKAEVVATPMSDEEITHRMTICKQDILLDLNVKLDERDAKLFKHIETQDGKMIGHLKDLMGLKP